MDKELIDKLKREGKWKVCAPDPALEKRTGYELANSFSKSGLARAGATELWKKEKSTKLELRRKRRKNRKKKSRKSGPTEKQLAFMKKLRVHVPKKCSSLHASRLIGRKLNEIRILKQDEALDEQLRMAMERDGL